MRRISGFFVFNFNAGCRDYTVWQNTATGEKSIVRGLGSAGFGWMPEKNNLCCGEAEAMTGKTGLCDSHAPTLGPGGVRRPGNTNTTTGANNGGIPNGGEDNRNATTYQTPLPTPPPVAVSNRWTLISVTASPEIPPQGDLKWSYNAQSTSANLDIYNGDTADFQWTKPPTQIDASGFAISFSTQCKSQPNNRCSSTIGVRGDGLTSDTPAGEQEAKAYGENGATGSKQKSVTYKPSPNSNELQLVIGLGWSDVKFIYKYRRAE